MSAADAVAAAAVSAADAAATDVIAAAAAADAAAAAAVGVEGAREGYPPLQCQRALHDDMM